MSLRMIPLREIPYAARATEANARRQFIALKKSLKPRLDVREDMARAAEFEIEEAPGTYANLPRSLGWVLTYVAAEALSNQMCNMHGGTSHHLFYCATLSDHNATEEMAGE